MSGLAGRVRQIAVFVLAVVAVASAGSAAAQTQPVVAFSARVAGDEHRARLVMDFDRRPDGVSVHYVDSPPRILVDLPETAFALQKGALAPRGLFDSIRYGAMGPGRSRIVLQTSTAARVDLKQLVPGEDGKDVRLILDVATVPRDDFAKLVKAEKWANDATSADDAPAAAPKVGRAHAFTVVVDPGHGGIDSGAVGVTGSLEKDVTLAFGKQLAADLREEDVHVVMTRTDDEFVSLADRVKIGRENSADLFVSIHANTISVKGIRGATVYTLSDKASDRLSQKVADDENKADAVAGVTAAQEPKGVADILMDLTRRETQVFSISLADKIVSSFEGKIRLINNAHRYAGFRVLEAPDVPSVLVELGYLSNAADEKLLNDPAWRADVAKLMTKSILRYRSTVLASRN